MTTIKVVREIHGELFSFYARANGVEVEYIPGEKVVPLVEGSKLFAFGELASVLEWLTPEARNHPPIQIWECIVGNPTIYKSRVMSASISRDAVQAFWQAISSKKVLSKELPTLHLMFAPLGTIACDSIILTRRIE